MRAALLPAGIFVGPVTCPNPCVQVVLVLCPVATPLSWANDTLVVLYLCVWPVYGQSGVMFCHWPAEQLRNKSISTLDAATGF
jgi:hypothetical protein